jgi:UDP-N-acetylmuramoylalanine--D-glutamate ligase
MDVKGKNVTVVGLARSGVAAANALVSMGARVTVTDRRPEAELGPQCALLAPDIAKSLGSHPDDIFTGADLVVISPGVPLGIPPIVKAAQAGVELMGELELAYRLSDSPFIAITGTNGKSTTTTLVGEMLKADGLDVLVGGNLGNALTEKPEALTGRDWVVAEVSSFQLEAIDEFNPKIAAILNVTDDHMDRYSSLEDYAVAKAQIFANQSHSDILVLNADDPIVMDLAESSISRKIPFSRTRHLREGVYVHEGIVIDATESGKRIHVINTDEIGIKGAHNLENALAATAICLAAGVHERSIARVLAEFKGLEHRLEPVRELDGVSYINDSKGTNVGAVMKSIESFESPVILIAGGLDKHSDFAPLVPLVKERVKTLVLIGKAADEMERVLGGAARVLRAANMEDAVALSKAEASPGDVVLLSPACASFDMFADFEDRGRKFKEAVMAL